MAHRAVVFTAACSLVAACTESSVVEHGSSTDARGSGGLTGMEGGPSGSAGSRSNAPCVDVSHVGPMQKKDLEVVGTGFDAYEGFMIRVLATLGEPAYGLGEAPIEGGAFDILMPGVLGDYTGLAVHVDRVRDDACNPDREFIWQQTTGPMSAWGLGLTTTSEGLAWDVTPDTLRVFEQAGPCNLNGIFDLTKPIPCPAAN